MKSPLKCPVCQGQQLSKKLDVKDLFFTKEDFSIWECSDCSVLFTWPQPASDEIGRYYETPAYLSHNTEQNGLFGKLYGFLRNINIRKKYKIVEKYISRGRLLDIGCGSGELLNYFAGRGWDTMGIEPNQTARAFAQKKYGLKIEGEREIKNLPALSFDVVSMWHVLEHVADVNERMEQVQRLLIKDGIAVIALPNPRSWDAENYQNYWAAYDVPRHLFHFSQKAFASLVQKHHFQITEILPLTMDAFYVSLLSERYKGGNSAFAKAFLSGLKSNRKAKHSGEYSSLIYILQKSHPGS